MHGPNSIQIYDVSFNYLTWDDYATFILLTVGVLAYVNYNIILSKPDIHYQKLFERPQSSGSDDSPTAPLNESTRNLATELQATGAQLAIIWGSQSGSSERMAHQLAHECWVRFQLKALVADASDYDPQTLAQPKFTVFLLSTYGEGDPSDNAIDFVSWLNSNNGTSLHNLRYAAFGLGSSNYKYYNRVVDVVVDGLKKAGATMILPLAKADDAMGMTEEAFLEWKEELFSMFRSHLGIEERDPGYQPMHLIVEYRPCHCWRAAHQRTTGAEAGEEKYSSGLFHCTSACERGSRVIRPPNIRQKMRACGNST